MDDEPDPRVSPGGEEPRFLHRDRDAIYGGTFERAIRSMGIEQVVNARKSPWPNPSVERVIGRIHRECTDHLVPLGGGNLLRVLCECVAWYDESRPHLSLDGNAPLPREVERDARLVTTLVLGGRHHRCHRTARTSQRPCPIDGRGLCAPRDHRFASQLHAVRRSRQTRLPRARSLGS